VCPFACFIVCACIIVAVVRLFVFTLSLRCVRLFIVFHTVLTLSNGKFASLRGRSARAQNRLPTCLRENSGCGF
jgi:hypothetical protein